ncbi:mitogen-activated protein kinase kinase kinase 1 [Quercus suber]|uniref:mitogen-activated protein kinase kinase kinase n=1 Tax=Quercus suber TaxID=58331 RepID=A0AAW0J371_QUESU
MIDKKTTRKANSNSQLANSQASQQRQTRKQVSRGNQKRNSRPKLDRRNTLKIVKYDASFDIAADDDDNDDLSSIGGRRSRSLDLPPFFHNQKSFRIEGIDGEFDLICRSLGLSGIDDFSIPAADWEAHRSNSDLATRLRNNLASSTSRLKPTQPVKLDEVRVRVGSVTAGPSQGIKGSRPPVLAPPPEKGRSVAVDHTSTWELFKSFAPLEDEVVAPNTTRLGGYAETTSSSSSSRLGGYAETTSSFSFSSASSDEEDNKQNEGKLGRSIGRWQKGELLGSGSFGTVYEGYTEDGFFFAVKEVSFLDQGSQGKQYISYLEQEISRLKQFEHENIVQYLGTDKDESRIYIFLELVTKGSLASLYQKYCLRDSQVSAYTRQILNGLKYLHKKNVIHRDIKCSNILVDASGSVKLADFGLAEVTKLIDIKSCIGNPFWMAPEVVNKRNGFYGFAADIWSLGCTVLEMLTRQHPYSHLEGVQALFMIGKGKPPLVPDSLSRDARDFILKCLQVSPNDRPTATQLLDHPFVTRPQNSFGPASPHNSIQTLLLLLLPPSPPPPLTTPLPFVCSAASSSTQKVAERPSDSRTSAQRANSQVGSRQVIIAIGVVLILAIIKPWCMVFDYFTIFAPAEFKLAALGILLIGGFLAWHMDSLQSFFSSCPTSGVNRASQYLDKESIMKIVFFVVVSIMLVFIGQHQQSVHSDWY